MFVYVSVSLICIGLFKMFWHWILFIFNVQIQCEKGNKFM